MDRVAALAAAPMSTLERKRPPPVLIPSVMPPPPRKQRRTNVVPIQPTPFMVIPGASTPELQESELAAVSVLVAMDMDPALRTDARTGISARGWQYPALLAVARANEAQHMIKSENMLVNMPVGFVRSATRKMVTDAIAKSPPGKVSDALAILAMHKGPPTPEFGLACGLLGLVSGMYQEVHECLVGRVLLANSVAKKHKKLLDRLYSALDQALATEKQSQSSLVVSGVLLDASRQELSIVKESYARLLKKQATLAKLAKEHEACSSPTAVVVPAISTLGGDTAVRVDNVTFGGPPPTPVDRPAADTNEIK